jgi:hypothetical protein
MTVFTPRTWSNGGAPAISAANLQAMDDGIQASHTELQAHLDDTVDAHDASAISNVAAGNIVATTVQAAVDELDTEKVAKAGDTITGALVVTATDAANVVPLTINQQDTLATNAINVVNTGTGDGLFLDQNGNGVALHIDNDGTANSITVEGTTATDLTLSKAGNLTVAGTIAGSNLSGTNTGDNTTATLEVVTDTVSATTYPALYEAATGSIAIHTDAGLTYNATTANLSTTTFTGALTGAASLNVMKSGDTMSGDLIFSNSQKIIGGTSTAADLTLQTTSGVGAAGADMHFLVGNNGATEAMTILNSGNVGIGETNPGQRLTLNATNCALSIIATAARDWQFRTLQNATTFTIGANHDSNEDGFNCFNLVKFTHTYGVANGRVYIDGGLTVGDKTIDAGDNNIYVVGDVSALIFTDRTPFYEGDAVEEIKAVKGKDGHIDHATLPAFAQKQDVDGTPTRDLGAMISILTIAVQQLTDRIEKLEKGKV